MVVVVVSVAALRARAAPGVAKTAAVRVRPVDARFVRGGPNYQRLFDKKSVVIKEEKLVSLDDDERIQA